MKFFMWEKKMKTKEVELIIKIDIYFSKTTIFGHILKKSTNSFFGAWLFLLVHIRCTPSEGPKAL
jgi:hypothetical protein